MSAEKVAELRRISEEHEALNFQNEGYQYIDKSKLSEDDVLAHAAVEVILSDLIEGFVKFENFCQGKHGLRVRVQYKWDYRFTGVGYFYLEQLIEEECHTS